MVRKEEGIIYLSLTKHIYSSNYENRNHFVLSDIFHGSYYMPGTILDALCILSMFHFSP